ncbi:MAG: bacteriorhodopsin [Prochloraceae cyanobacterium]
MFATELLSNHFLLSDLFAQTANAVPGINMENFLEYTPIQRQLISHLLTLGVSTMACGFVYFLATMKSAAPRYQASSVFSAVVMVSAFLILFRQLNGWLDAFEFDGTVWKLTVAELGTFTESTFNNGYRYLNWSIDVPLLLTQMLFLFDLNKGHKRRLRIKFVTAGLLMIYTGYVGQYFEVTNLTAFFIWGAVSTVFYVYILFLVGNLIGHARKDLPEKPRKMFMGVWWLILISWTLYPLAYLVPWIWQMYPAWGGWAAVTRQFLFTMADIFSKVIYGVLLTNIAFTRSAIEGYQPALGQEITNGKPKVKEREYIER